MNCNLNFYFILGLGVVTIIHSLGEFLEIEMC